MCQRLTRPDQHKGQLCRAGGSSRHQGRLTSHSNGLVGPDLKWDIIAQDIFRKYPHSYEAIIPTLCNSLEELDEPEAKASLIWIIGEYAEKIENADELLAIFVDTFIEESYQVRPSVHLTFDPIFNMGRAAGPTPNSHCGREALFEETR